MGRTNTRQQPQRWTDVFDSVHGPLHQTLEGDEGVECKNKSDLADVYNDEADQEMSQTEDSGSVPTTMGVRLPALDAKKGNNTATGDGRGGYAYYDHHRRAPSTDFRDFLIPQTPLEIAALAAADAVRNGLQDMQQDENSDDISVLTEYSGMEEEEDASSQVTAGTEARTVVTNTTGSTTIPTRNVGQVATVSSSSQQKIAKRRNAAVDKLNGFPPLDNSQYKRRRVR